MTQRGDIVDRMRARRAPLIAALIPPPSADFTARDPISGSASGFTNYGIL